MYATMESKYLPFNGHIVLSKITEAKTTRIGLELTSKESSQLVTDRGEVLSVSKEASDAGIKSGDTLHYRKGRSFQVILPDGDKVTLIRIDDVIIRE
jgi:co-chaperonin GroES (HSP10)